MTWQDLILSAFYPLLILFSFWELFLMLPPWGIPSVLLLEEQQSITWGDTCPLSIPRAEAEQLSQVLQHLGSLRPSL